MPPQEQEQKEKRRPGSVLRVPSLPVKLFDWAGGDKRTQAVSVADTAARAVGSPAGADLPRLTYFNARGRAEVIRIMCAEASFHYEDYRFRPNIENECRQPASHADGERQCLCQTHGPGNDEFVEFRLSGKSVTGTVPLLEVDGLAIVQTSAICRYLANRFGMAGASDAEKAYVDVVASTLDDLYIYMVQSMQERKVGSSFYTQLWPKVANQLEKMAELYSTTQGYFVGNHLSWVDIYGFHMFTRVQEGLPTAMDRYPRLKAVVANVSQRPRVKSWLAERERREADLGNYIDWLL